MIRRRLPILFLLIAFLLPAQTPEERLAAAARLWVYVKYFHPGVTAAGIDWDAAFESTAPQVLAVKSDEEFVAALNQMLGALHDPATRIPARGEFAGGMARIVPAFVEHDGVTVVTYQSGDQMQAMQASQGMAGRLRGKGAVVFDLRGMRTANFVMPSALPVSKTCAGPDVAMRFHSGYEPENRFGSGGYRSTWNIEDGVRLAAGTGGIRAVFLVDHATTIPAVALTMQNCGEGAIMAEEPLSPAQAGANQGTPVLGRVYAFVRTTELVYPDGTTGIGANAVIPQRGADALHAAEEMARSGKWPAPQDRPKRTAAPARFSEKSYADDRYPAAPRRMLAAARVWGVFQMFHPYRHLYGEDWNAVLPEFLTKMAQAENARDYHLAVAEMVAHVHDTHCFVGSPELTEYYGSAAPPVELRWIEEQPVVTRVFNTTAASPGDVLVRIEGKPFRERADDLARHISASTPQSSMARVLGTLLNGPQDSVVHVTLRGADGTEREAEFTRERKNNARFRPFRTEEAIRLVRPDIGYVDLERLSGGQVDTMFEKFSGTRAIIMDMRGYPQGTAWSIAPRIADAPQKVAAVFRRNLVSPGAIEGNNVNSLLFEQRIPPTDKPRYTGKTVMLIDDRAISQSEHSGLFYKTANGTVFIGSPTTGANGDVTNFMAPGGISINFSGHDVRWPDGKQLQRVGLIPDIEVRPTIAGIRAGRDEVLERALQYLEK
jgi:C-terminal processing protease CtpA/Prc